MKRREAYLKRSHFSIPYFAKILILTTFALLLAYFWPRNSTITPLDALKRAREAIAFNEFLSADNLLSIAESENAINGWTKFYRGELLKNQGKFDPAIEVFLRITKDDAAYPDAQLKLLETKLARDRDYLKTQSALEEAEALTSIIEKVSRSDLDAQIGLIKAQLAEIRGAQLFAFDQYIQSAEKKQNSDFTQNAILAAFNIAKNSNLDTIPLTEQLLAVKLALKTRNIEIAEKWIQHLMQLNIPQVEVQNAPDLAVSQELARILVVQEKLLRSQNNLADADKIVDRLSQLQVSPYFEELTLLRIKNAWNVNDYDMCFELIEGLRAKIVDQKILDELTYIEGRIWEELEKFNKARNRYKQLINSSQGEFSIKALRRLAWLYILDGNNLEAAKRLLKLSKLTDQLSVEDLHHVYFWLASTVEALPEEMKQQEFPNFNTSDLQKKILIAEPNTYYSQIKKTEFGEQRILAIGEQNKNNCPLLKIDPALENRLLLLSSSSLFDLIDREIEWYFRTADENPTEERTTQTQITMATLAANYGLASKAIQISERIVRTSDVPHNGEVAPLKEICSFELKKLLFPTPYLPLFKQKADFYKLPPELLLGIARTESHFNSLAISSKGALGLLQLMPKTAREEGLIDEKQLFVPEINIEYSARHLSRLLRTYGGDFVFSIAAYNAGSGAVNRWRHRYPDLEEKKWIEMISFPETQRYVKSVLIAMREYEKMNLR